MSAFAVSIVMIGTAATCGHGISSVVEIHSQLRCLPPSIYLLGSADLNLTVFPSFDTKIFASFAQKWREN
jgi:hypothetical protein